MSRWEPNARGRLEQAALELFERKGFDSTTVAEIAQHAGLTERTFFRHFADKREVLFSAAGTLRDSLASTVDGAPAALSPMEAVAAGLVGIAAMFEERRDMSRRRQAVIDANAELQERELIKLAALASALADALHGRGLAAPTARLAAEAGIAAFRVAFERWIGDDAGERALADHIRESVDELRTLAGGRAATG
ncbi:TetR family transcriptional regulator [Streptomyces sp. B1866]|uniref:TetR family transcriptional regulator n=1 Tax=Streptomyces sp. B1866 TaxID=3075431 RepID=UPI00288EF907|nr:TetR family transcriptional regulator [Streptomyces sp. B1866]MDT3396209.1 TetR family transcriptional regulator [Streptomyces sp. B1866]